MNITILLQKILLESLILFYFYFMLQSPMFGFVKDKMKKTLSIWKVQSFKIDPWVTKRWWLSKIEYAYNCAFCLPGWILIIYAILNPTLSNAICAVTVPGIVFFVWLIVTFLKEYLQLIRKFRSK